MKKTQLFPMRTQFKASISKNYAKIKKGLNTFSLFQYSSVRIVTHGTLALNFLISLIRSVRLVTLGTPGSLGTIGSLLLLTVGTISSQPLDDIVKRTTIAERQILKHPPLREADILWEKRIWRVIDTREKMNQPFRYPQAPFFKILQTASLNGDITLYSTENDKFSLPLSDEETEGIFFQQDTFEVWNPDTDESEIRAAINEINWENVNRFRIKEVWFFDTRTSTMRVRILGIAPLIDVFTDSGEFRNEKPLFWAYFPELRNYLAREEVYTVGNDAALNSWNDLFEMRFFSSYIYKESNVQDNRLKDITTGVDLLLEADKIKQEIFNYEHDLWSY